jgi:hypothetical protein
MIAPRAGQFVRLPDHDERLVVKSLSEDESRVELETVTDDHRAVHGVKVTELLPGEDLSAG